MNWRDHSPFRDEPPGARSPRRPRKAPPLQGASATALLVALLGMPLAAPSNAQETSPGTVGDQFPKAVEGLPAPAGAIPDDVAALLPLLVTSPERKQFAADLEAAIRMGKLDAAERQLKGAIETGTLAIVLVDRLGDPSLLLALQTLGIKPSDGSPSPTTKAEPAASCSLAAAPPLPNLSDMQEAMEREQARADAVSWELSALTEEFHRLQQSREDAASAAPQLKELQAALQKERERAEAAQVDLASLRKDYSDLKAQRESDVTSHEAAASAMQEALALERQRSEKAREELAAAKIELESAQKAKEAETGSAMSQTAALQESLRRERESLQRERERADAAARELADARRDLANARKDTAEMQALREREAAAAVGLAQLREALARERARGDETARELADAIDELRVYQETRTSGPAPIIARLAATGIPGPQETRPEDVPPQPSQPIVVAMIPGAGGGEVARTSTAAPPPAEGARAVAALPVQAGRQDRASVSPPPVAENDRVPATPTPAPGAEDRIVKRADALLRSGDVSGARLLLEHATQAGNAQAAFMLAETFDPNVLSQIGVLGIRGDAAKARELYARALSLGVRQAGERMQALK